MAGQNSNKSHAIDDFGVREARAMNYMGVQESHIFEQNFEIPVGGKFEPNGLNEDGTNSTKNLHTSFNFGIKEARNNNYLGPQDNDFITKHFPFCEANTNLNCSPLRSNDMMTCEFGIREARKNNYMRSQDEKIFKRIDSK